MSETTRYRPWAEPGAADVMFVPNWTEHPEPGGVNWTTRKPLSNGEVGVEPPAEAAVELLRPVDVRDRDDDDLELHVHAPVRGLRRRAASPVCQIPSS